jgi:hypothetical protein
MTEVIVAAFMWALVIALIATIRARLDQSVLYASGAVAMSLLFNIDPLYLSVDVWLGGRNWLDLFANLLLLTGVYFLSRTVLRAVNGPTYSSVPLRIGLAAVLAAIAVLFVFIEAPSSSTTFMADYGAQLPAALYSIVQFSYVGLVMMTTAVACIRYRGSMTTPGFRVGLAIIAAGCLSTIALVLVILTLDLLHLVGSPLMNAIGSLYSPVYVLSVVLLCTGFATAPLSRFVGRFVTRRRISASLKELGVILSHRAGEAPTALAAESREAQLHRLVVSLRDAVTAQPEEPLAPGDATALERAERLLLRPMPANALPPA